MTKRSREERLRLLNESVDELLSEAGLDPPFNASVEFITGAVTTSEPRREDLRSYLMQVRLFDAPREDLFIPALADDLDVTVEREESREVVAFLRARYEDVQTSLDIHLEDAQGTISPRWAFEMLVYGEHMHKDAKHQERARAMPREMWAMVRALGIDYADAVMQIAVGLRAVAQEDPGTARILASR